jgi:hypothetical protein
MLLAADGNLQNITTWSSGEGSGLIIERLWVQTHSNPFFTHHSFRSKAWSKKEIMECSNLPGMYGTTLGL